MKIALQLVEAGFVESVRGRSGGLRLARPANEMRVGDIAMRMEGDQSLVDCTACILRGACGLFDALHAAKREFYRFLNRYSLAEAVEADPRTLPILRAGPGFRGRRQAAPEE